MVQRKQDLFRVDVTLVAGTPKEFTLPRPETLPALSNTIDHVTEPTSRRQHDAGKCILDISVLLGDISDLLVTKLSKIRDPGHRFTEAPEPEGSAEEPLFPTGAPTEDEEVFFEDATGIAPAANSEVERMLEELSIRANEKIKITFLSASGGSGTLPVSYDMGRNQAEIAFRSP